MLHRKTVLKRAGIFFLFLILILSLFLIKTYTTNYFENDNIDFTTDVFQKGEGGYFCFRIPGLIVLPGGRIIVFAVFAEGRVESVSDYGNIDLVMKYSDDGGRTWSNMIQIWDAGDVSLSNPCPVYDRETGVLFLHVVKDRRESYVLNSTDGGLSWSSPKQILIGKEEWFFSGSCPGHGIQLKSGRLLIPGMYNLKENGEETGKWGSFITIVMIMVCPGREDMILG